MRSLTPCALAGVLALCLNTAQPTVIDFEGFAPAADLVNVNPGAPYSEDGFTLMPTNFDSAVFDAAADTDMPGNATDFFGFAENHIVTLTGAAPFDLTSMLIGPNTLGNPPLSLIITATLFGGGTINGTFQGLNTATLAVLNWTNLLNVQFRTTDHAAIDNIVLNENTVSEPTSLALFGLGLAGVGYSRRQTRA